MLKRIIKPMVRTARLTPVLLAGSLALLPAQVRAESTRYSSPISEVDACNQAQYQMPEAAVVKGFRLNTRSDRQGNHFDCTVSWTRNSKASPTYAPITFPNRIAIPVIWSGWF